MVEQMPVREQNKTEVENIESFVTFKQFDNFSLQYNVENDSFQKVGEDGKSDPLEIVSWTDESIQLKTTSENLEKRTLVKIELRDGAQREIARSSIPSGNHMYRLASRIKKSSDNKKEELTQEEQRRHQAHENDLRETKPVNITEDIRKKEGPIAKQTRKEPRELSRRKQEFVRQLRISKTLVKDINPTTEANLFAIFTDRKMYKDFFRYQDRNILLTQDRDGGLHLHEEDKYGRFRKITTWRARVKDNILFADTKEGHIFKDLNKRV